MNGWVRLCGDCWYHFNPTEYLPDVPVVDFERCDECGYESALYGLRVSVYEAAKDTEAHS